MTDDSPLVFMPRRKRKRDASEQRPSEQPARRVSGARRALDSTAAGTATATASSSAMREPSLLRGASMLRGASVASRRPKRKTFVDDECIAQTPFTMKRDMSRAREQKPAAATTTLPPPFLVCQKYQNKTHIELFYTNGFIEHIQKKTRYFPHHRTSISAH